MFWKRKKREKAVYLHKENFSKIIEQNNLVFIFFKASWCGSCKIITPIIHDLAHENREKEVLIGVVHVDSETDLSQKYNIRSIPHLYVFQNKEVVYSGTGMISKPRIQEMIDMFIEQKNQRF